jgi:hypothetical protein
MAEELDNLRKCDFRVDYIITHCEASSTEIISKIVRHIILEKNQ